MATLSRCDSCGNQYERLMAIEFQGDCYQFDCFECAIQKLAPHCSHCGTRILGHGLETSSKLYCCANCARAEGERGLRDSTHDLIESA